MIKNVAKSKTNQQIFDKVALSSLKQGKKSLGKDGLCVYRKNKHAKDHVRCNAGHLIPDSVYTSEMEGSSIHVLADKFPNLPKQIGVSKTQLEGIIRDLQLIHDSVFNTVAQWPSELRQLAVKYELNSNVVDEFLLTSSIPCGNMLP